MRILLSAGLLLATTSCTYWDWSWNPPPGQLALTNYRFDHAALQAVVTTAPECGAPDPAAPSTAFVLPFKGTRVIVAAPSADVCWRRQLANGDWTDWNRAFTGTGRFIDSQL